MRQGPNGRRPRGRPNRRPHGGPPRSSSYDSNGPEGRVRGNAHQVYEKYIALARDALSAGDRIAAETYYQHAEHYFRILNSSTDPDPAQRRQAARNGGNGPGSGDGWMQGDHAARRSQAGAEASGPGGASAGPGGQAQAQPGSRPNPARMKGDGQGGAPTAGGDSAPPAPDFGEDEPAGA